MNHQILAENAEELLKHNSLRTFRDVWELKADWIEPPNFSRGGWSGASRVVLKTPTGGSIVVFLKRQENHQTRSLRAPFGMPTFRREYNNIKKLRKLGIPTVHALYYGEERIDGKSCAAIITVALDGYMSLDDWWSGQTDPILRVKAMDIIARWTAAMSIRRLQHGCLYGKHIFLSHLENSVSSDMELRFIDLESMRRRFTVNHAARHNRDQLLRRTPTLSKAEHEYLDSALMREIGLLLRK